MGDKKISSIWMSLSKAFNYMNWGVFVIQNSIFHQMDNYS
jgi:hypothetical protein